MTSFRRIPSSVLRDLPVGSVVELLVGSRYIKTEPSASGADWVAESTGHRATSGVMSLNNLRIVSDLELLAETKR